MTRPAESEPQGVLRRLYLAAGLPLSRTPKYPNPPRALADLIGASEVSVRNWKKRGGQVPGDALVIAATRLGISVDELIQKEDPDFNGSGFDPKASSTAYLPGNSATVIRTGGDGSLLVGVLGEPSIEYQVVPRFHVRVSAGRGAAPFDEEKRGTFAFDSAWMRKHLGRSGDGFASVEVRGDSMEPALLDGEEIIIDRRVNRVDASGIYVIALRGDLLVKRVQRKLDGTLIVRGDNPAYEPETLTAERAEDLRIVGRMVWPRVR